jgi:4-hydroxybenzoate polyprenyltransferase/predicted HAD superfamily phosphohydrolase YqeG
MKTFLELDENALKNSQLIIDIDGTIVHDKGLELDPEAVQKLFRLKQHSDVYLCSNGHQDRTKALAEKAGVFYIDTLHRKPSRYVVEKLERSDKPVIVIGDKMLTDGLFAVNIAAKFIPVKRIRHRNDPVIIKLHYFIDDVVSIVMRPLYPALPYIALLRPFQWVKNLLILAPVFFAGNAFNVTTFSKAVIAAIVFCAISSAMYIFNDIRDVEQDRLHPAKRLRPLASGRVSMTTGWVLFFGFLVLSIGGMIIAPAIIPVIIAYAVLNTLYSLWLKRVAVLDLISVAFSYILRIIAGGLAASIFISPWIILCVLFASLFVIIGKRRAEFRHDNRRVVLDTYSPEALNFMLAASASLAVMSYGVWSVIEHESPYLVYSTIFVVFVFFRMLNRIYTHPHDAESPELLVFKDRFIFVGFILWLLYVFFVFYSMI